MREKVEDMAGLAAALREAAAENETWRGSLLSVANAISEPTAHWIGPFKWHGGECPLPPETMVRIWLDSGECPAPEPPVRAHQLRWKHVRAGNITSFSYAADNAAGWIERPEGWVPPDEAWGLEHKRNGEVGERELRDYEWKGVTHIRLLPRKPALDALIQAARERGSMTEAEWLAQRESYVRGEMGIGSDRDEAAFRSGLRGEWRPIPADTRAVVREALMHAEAILDNCGMIATSNKDKGPFTTTGAALDKVHAALAALDAAPAEKVVGYAVVDSAGAPGIHGTDYTMLRGYRDRNEPGSRIVRLVAEPE